MEIHCETYGIPHDCEKKKNIFHSVSVIKSNVIQLLII